MIQVTVKAFADFRELLGREQLLSLPEGKTVRGLLETLGEHSGPFLPKVLDHDGRLKPAINILQNGRNIQSGKGLESLVADGDTIALFPPIAGG